MSRDSGDRRTGGTTPLDRLWVPALGSFVLAILFLTLLLVRAGGDASLLVHAGPPWTDPAETRDSLTVQDPERAFDGQFFYRLGVDPWSTADTVDGVTFDLPALRNTRWGYGALAWLASAGDADRVPAALLIINLGAAAVLGGLGGAVARAAGRHAAWGGLFALWPGFAYSLSLDTAELLASVFVLAGLVAAHRRRWVGVALALTIAVLVRDTAAVVPFGFLLAGAIGWIGHRRRSVDSGSPDSASADAASSDDPSRTPATSENCGHLLAGSIPLLGFAAWQLLQRMRFGAWPLASSGDNNLDAPLLGLLRLLGDVVTRPGGDTVFRAVFAVGLIALIAAAALMIRDASTPQRWAWVAAVGVVVVLNAYLWSGATAFMRASTEAGILSIAILMRAPSLRPKTLAMLASGLGAGWFLTAAAQIAKLT